MAIQLEFLKSLPYFSGLSLAELDLLKKVIFEKTAERGEIILLEGDSAEELFFVVSGAVKIFKTSADGKEQILSIVRPGESFNDVPIFDNGQSPASVAAMTTVVLYGMSKLSIEGVIKEHQQVALNIIKVLAEQVRQLLSLVGDLSFRHVTNRVAKTLLEYAGDGTGIKQRLTQQEMAAIAGTAREVVARSLRVLESEGAIRLEHHRIVITDKEALQRMAGSS